MRGRMGLLGLLLWAGCGDEGEKDGTPDPDTDAVDTEIDSDTDPQDTDLPEEPFQWPATAEDYVVDNATYVHTWTIPAVATDCCRDWGAISKDRIEEGTDLPDNALAELAIGVGELLQIDVQALIDGAVASGAFTLVLDHVGLPSSDGPYRMAVFGASFAEGTTYGEAAAGTGSFLLDPDAFVPGTGTPVGLFEPVSRTGDRMHAEGGSLEIFMPFGVVDLALPVSEVTLDAVLAADGAGVAAGGGTMSGAVALDDVFLGLNALVNASCECLGRTDDLFTKDGTWTGDCQLNAAQLCPAPEEEVCRSLAGLPCLALPLIMNRSADLDTDPGATGYEAISVGLRWEGASATIEGVAPAR